MLPVAGRPGAGCSTRGAKYCVSTGPSMDVTGTMRTTPLSIRLSSNGWPGGIERPAGNEGGRERCRDLRQRERSHRSARGRGVAEDATAVPCCDPFAGKKRTDDPGREHGILGEATGQSERVDRSCSDVRSLRRSTAIAWDAGSPQD